MSVQVIDTLKPKNNGTFPIVDAEDVSCGTVRLNEALNQKADKSELAQTNAALAGKASTAEVTAATNNLQSQINELITPVTQDAEVQNARVGTDGTSYTTLKERLDAENAELSTKLQASTKSVTISSSGRTNLIMHIGDIIEIDVSAISGLVQVFTSGYTSENIITLTATTKYTYTAIRDGYLTFYAIDSATFTATLKLTTELSTNIVQCKNEIEKIDNALNLTLDNHVVESFGATDIYLNSGETVDINVKNVDGYVSAFIVGHTGSGVVEISENKVYTFTALFDGYLSFYSVSATVLSAEIYLKSDLKTQVNNNSFEILKMDSFIFDKIDGEVISGDIDTADGSEISSVTKLRTVKTFDSSLASFEFNNDYTASVFAYSSDETYIGRYTGSGFSKNWQDALKISSPFNATVLSDDYIYKITFVRKDGESPDSTSLALKLIICNITNNAVETYTVGEGKQFETFTAMLVALENNANKKIVYVYGGNYDIFDEIGGSTYMQELDTTGLNWRDVCHVVPPNTTIIGIGNVVLKWNPTDAEIIDQNHAFLFSPLNLSGTCKIENIKIECTNCRYGIHDETSALPQFDGVIHEFENVSVTYPASTYGVQYAYGAGHNKNSKYSFKNCTFSAAVSEPWSMHDNNGGVSENSSFNFDNCAFIDLSSSEAPAIIRLLSNDTVGRTDEIKINGCVFSGIRFTSASSNNVKQGYVVQTMLCKPYQVTFGDNILENDRIMPTNYLVLPE